MKYVSIFAIIGMLGLVTAAEQVDNQMSAEQEFDDDAEFDEIKAAEVDVINDSRSLLRKPAPIIRPEMTECEPLWTKNFDECQISKTKCPSLNSIGGLKWTGAGCNKKVNGELVNVGDGGCRKTLRDDTMCACTFVFKTLTTRCETTAQNASVIAGTRAKVLVRVIGRALGTKTSKCAEI